MTSPQPSQAPQTRTKAYQPAQLLKDYMELQLNSQENKE
ncbi:hypothetical protein RintRC_1044 [Richelia intracellularis]|nr:hypothetical protein RintRC_1044 [Richelia intracellularis]